MEAYMSDWRLFRRLSDENRVTAEHILQSRRWPRRKAILRVADFGCGDGMLIQALLVQSPTRITTVHLVDPDSELLEQAKSRVREIPSVSDLQATLARAEDVVRDITRKTDAALAVHLVYLLKENELRKLLGGLTPGCPFFIVMDERKSIFSKLWKKTAPKYYRRTMRAREIIESLDGDAYAVEKTEFDTHLDRPSNSRGELEEAVISLLCYKDFVGFDKETQSWIKSTISEYTVSGKVVCNCACYEILRR